MPIPPRVSAVALRTADLTRPTAFYVGLGWELSSASTAAMSLFKTADSLLLVCTDREQLAQLAKVGPAAGHVAGSAATIALVAPTSDDVQRRDLVQFDLGQATMSVMLAAADLASAAPTRALATRNSRDACWASPGTGSAPC